MKRWIIGGLIGVTAAVIAGGIVFAWPKPPIPSAIKSQLTSTLMLPATTQATVDRSTVKYDGSLKVLSLHTVTRDGRQIIISEQPTPDQFVDVPQAYQKVLDGMNDYSDFDTGVGTVHLTKPQQLHGGQTAVLNAKGTLLFAKPSANLSTDQWRQFFNSFDVAR